MPDEAQRTEAPTPRRIEQARREGHFAASPEVAPAAQLLVLAILAAAFAGGWFTRLAMSVRFLFERAFQFGRPHGSGLAAPAELDPADVVAAARFICAELALPLGLAGLVLLSAGLAVQLATTRFGFTPARLAPKLRAFEPATRFREQLSRNLSVLRRRLWCLPGFAAVAYVTVGVNGELIRRTPPQDVAAEASRLSSLVLRLLWASAGFSLAVAAVDLWRQRRQYLAGLRMTRQEVRDEIRETEGHPLVRARIRRLHARLALQRALHGSTKP